MYTGAQHTSVHENYLSVHKTYSVHEIGFGVHEMIFKTYTSYSLVAD